jgi:hypothetical protein
MASVLIGLVAMIEIFPVSALNVNVFTPTSFSLIIRVNRFTETSLILYFFVFMIGNFSLLYHIYFSMSKTILTSRMVHYIYEINTFLGYDVLYANGKSRP